MDDRVKRVKLVAEKLFEGNHKSIQYNQHIDDCFHLSNDNAFITIVKEDISKAFYDMVFPIVQNLTNESIGQVFDLMRESVVTIDELFGLFGITVENMVIDFLIDMDDSYAQSFVAYLSLISEGRLLTEFEKRVLVVFFKRGFLMSGFCAEFSTLGASGMYGPTEVGDYYKDSPHGDVIVRDGIQLWEVPKNGYYLITAIGATGGDSTENTTIQPGWGAKISARLFLSCGDVLEILVGQMGGIARGTSNRAGGGGGGTFVVMEDKPLVIAGGGHGCNWGSFNRDSPSALLDSGRTNPTSNGRGGEGGGFKQSGVNHGNEKGGSSFKNGGVGGKGTYGDGGFGGGGGALYEGGGGGGYQGGIPCGENQYQVDFSNHGATSFICKDGDPEECCLHTTVSHGKVIISFLG